MVNFLNKLSALFCFVLMLFISTASRGTDFNFKSCADNLAALARQYDLHNLATYEPQLEVKTAFALPISIKTGDRVRVIGRPEFLKVNRIRLPFVELVDPLGRRRYFKLEQDTYSVLFVEIKQTDTAFEKSRPVEHVDLPARNFNFRHLDAYRFAEALSDSQAEASTAISDKQLGSSKEALVMANRKMITDLRSAKRLTSEAVAEWNYKTFDPASEKAKYAGVLRGTKKLADGDWIDFTDEWEAATNSQGAATLIFSKPEEVPQRMEKLLEQVNALNNQSKFAQAVAVYREFITIHPFSDGNGRTARMLLDYCLMKIGYRPIKHSSGTRTIYYQTEEELEQQLLKTYR